MVQGPKKYLWKVEMKTLYKFKKLFRFWSLYWCFDIFALLKSFLRKTFSMSCFQSEERTHNCQKWNWSLDSKGLLHCTQKGYFCFHNALLNLKSLKMHINLSPPMIWILPTVIRLITNFPFLFRNQRVLPNSTCKFFRKVSMKH